MQLPVLSFSKTARRRILKKGGVLHLTRHPKAGRTGYSPDLLLAETEVPEHASTCTVIQTEGITVYISSSLSVDKYEQIDVWLTRAYMVFVTLRARITLYKRLSD
ncbi:MAG: hypothetical protein RL177_1281 [Bacteroidota bacterium]|jgi:hypothetical protein